jgi:sulfatase maturation enzyme AslB (radical SAM superfamily)
MARPKPTILLTHVDPGTYKSEEVLEAEAIYAVFYKGRPFNLRTFLNSLQDYPGPKYKKVSFSNPGHAFNLMEKMNKLFKCSDFTVVELKEGSLVNESDLIKKADK